MRVASVAGIVLLTGCTLFDNQKGAVLNPADDYLDASRHRPLVIPEDMQGVENIDPFPIPEIVERSNPSFYPKRPPLPDAIYASENQDQVRVQRLGERSWLVVPEPPTTAWPKLKQFFADNGVALTYDAPEVGRLNTDWLEVTDEETYRDVVRAVLKDAKTAAMLMAGVDRFVIRVEQGMRLNSTEVHIRHENDDMGLPMPDDVAVINDFRSHNTDAEADLLNEVGAYIAAKVAETTVSKVALQIGSSQKSEIALNREGFPVLRLYLDYERAWATLGQALGNAEVDVIDLSREDGIFHVNIPPVLFTEEEEKGFFCRLTFSCGSDDELDVVLHVEASNETGYDVTVHGMEGRFMEPEISQQVLVMIRDFAT